MNKEPKIKTFSDGLAFTISAVFSPYVIALVFIAMIVYNFSDNLKESLPWVLTFLIFGVLIPGLYVLWLMESKKITDIHISNLNERKVPFIVAGISSVIGASLIIFLGAPKAVIVMALAYSINTLIIGAITQFWKISIHTALFSSLVTVAVVLFGTNFIWLYLFLVPLSWSRLHRSRHTFWQTLTGALLAFAITIIIFWSFGYI